MSNIQYSTDLTSWQSASIAFSADAVGTNHSQNLFNVGQITSFSDVDDQMLVTLSNGLTLRSPSGPQDVFTTGYKTLEGIDWTTVEATGNTGALGMDQGNGLWVAVGNLGMVITSTDTITWTTQTANVGNARLNTVVYGNGLWVLGGGEAGTNTGLIRTSTDAVTWITRTSNFPANQSVVSIAYGIDGWVAGGYSGQLRTSTDAITWVTRTSTFGTTTIQSIGYGNGLWVAGGPTGQIRTSTNSVTWTTRTSNFGTINVNTVAYGNGLWVAGGFGTAHVRTSTNGITWTTRTSNLDTLNVTVWRTTYGNGLWVLAGTGTTICTSTDAITWTTRNSNFIYNKYAVVRGEDGKWMLGVNRTSENKTFEITKAINHNNRFVGVGVNRNVSTSTNGITWTAQSGPTNVNNILSTSGSAIAVADEGVIWKSIDSISWVSLSIGNVDNLINLGDYNGKFAVQGNLGIYSSTDLISWTTITIPVSASSVNDIIGLE